VITVVGIGPGNLALLTQQARQAIACAGVLVGGRRHLKLFEAFEGETHLLTADIAALVAWLEGVQQQDIVLLASGDPMLFGIGKRLCDHFGRENIDVIPGVSAMQYLCAKAGVDMNDIWLTSSHGREVDYENLLRHNKVALVTDRNNGPAQIARHLVAWGAGQRTMIIGENLSLENERIRRLPASVVTGDFDMNVVVILNE
jgi:cobalt-precorrin-7 (C5)-methyltransferase